jgi:hypothetical protein
VDFGKIKVCMEEQGYKKLEVYQLAHKLAVKVHGMSMQLPKHEMYEQGSQIRRSSKSISAQIVEGYALRKNKNEFLQYLNRDLHLQLKRLSISICFTRRNH